MLLKTILAAMLLAPEGDAPTGGAPSTTTNATTTTQQAPQTEKAFTQSDVDRIVQDRLKGFGDYNAVKAKAAQVDVLTKQLEELSIKVDGAGKSDVEREMLALKREREKLAGTLADTVKERDEKATAAASLGEQLKGYVTRSMVVDALTKAGVYGPAIEHAVSAFVADGKAELSPDEKNPGQYLLTMRIAGRTYDSPADAAKAWLAVNAHFAAAPAGGTGHQAPNGMGGRPLDLDKVPTVGLLQAGLSTPLRR